MSDPAPPRRRSGDNSRLPVVTEPAAEAPRAGRTRRIFAAFAAHLLGQDGRRRGLNGGVETLDAARESYLKAEYSGEADRRPTAGLVARKDV